MSNESNPSLQCSVCGQWKRMFGVSKKGISFQRFYPVCGENGEYEHLKNVCNECCKDNCPYRNKAAEQEGQGEKKATFKFYLVDGGMPYFGGYKAGSMTEGDPQLFFNCEAVMQQIKDEPKDEMAVSFKDIMLSTLTHEFCHAMQEWLNMEFDELQVEKILGAYNEKWNVFGGEEDLPDDSEEAVFKINDMLRFLDNEPESELKGKILNIFNAHDLWRKAHEQHAIENPPTPSQPSGTGEQKKSLK